jgi:uroporphyrinogen-III synthase
LKQSVEVDESFDVLVFTSPSNVEAYFEKNKVFPAQKLIAMGESTGKALEKLKHKNYTMPLSFDDLGLVQAVLNVSNR